MRMISVKRLESGMQLAKPIRGADGRMLLREHVLLTDRYILSLQKLGLRFVFIADEATTDIQLQESISPEVSHEVLSRIQRIYTQLGDSSHSQQLLQSGRVGREFTELFKMLFQSLLDDDTFILNLSSIYSNDAYLYTHSMNVGLSACILGMAHGYNDKKIVQFGVGAMLHDIGKLQINRAILNKPGALTQEERAEVERHCELGYQFLLQQAEIATVSAHCALQHHEKFDGTGYPRQLHGLDIHEFGRILAVPDVYDAMTSNRVYRKALLPHEGIEYLYSQSGVHFDQQFVRLFAKHVNIYPNGLPVDLSNGAKGVVARMNKFNLQRPVILVLEEAGRTVTPYELDLLKELNVTITGCELVNDDRIVTTL